MRQTKTASTGRERQRCSACSCGTWHRDAMSGSWSGPWHFQDCPLVPGGAELRVLNARDLIRWQSEPRVPKAQAVRILAAIMFMMEAPSKKVMLERKAAILAELAALESQQPEYASADTGGEGNG